VVVARGTSLSDNRRVKVRSKPWTLGAKQQCSDVLDPRNKLAEHKKHKEEKA
jgi:hypothetical protein